MPINARTQTGCQPPDFNCPPKPTHICNFEELADLLGVDAELIQYCLEATVTAAPINAGDQIIRSVFYDTSVTPAVVISQTYYNQTQNVEVTEAEVNATSPSPCVSATNDYELVVHCMSATVDAGTVTAGDEILVVTRFDVSSAPATIVETQYFNKGTLTAIDGTDYTNSLPEPCDDVQREYLSQVMCIDSVSFTLANKMIGVSSPNTLIQTDVWPDTYSSTTNNIFAATPDAIAADPDMARAWAIQGGSLHEIDLSVPSITNSTALTGDAISNPNSLAFDYSTGTLWLAAAPNSNSTTVDFFTIDTGTAVATLQGTSNYSGDYQWGMGFNITVDGKMYISDVGNQVAGNGVYEIDKTTFDHVTTVIDNATLLTFLSPNCERIRAMAFLDLNTIYIDGSRFVDRLYVLELDTGSYVERDDRTYFSVNDLAPLASAPVQYLTGYQFLRVYEVNEDTGAIIGFTDYDFDGNDITGIDDGSAVPCEPLTLRDVELVCMTDDNGTFLRHFVYDGSVISSTFDTDEAGDEYTPVGTVSICNGAVAATQTLTPQYETIAASSTWNMPANLTRLIITVVDATGSPTLTTPGNATQTLYTGEIVFEATQGNVLDETGVQVDTGVGSVVTVAYVEVS